MSATGGWEALTLPYKALGPRGESVHVIAVVSPDDRRVIDGGAAKCKVLDHQADAHFSQHYTADERRSVRREHRLQVLEADWVATDAALYYVTPAVKAVWRRSWSEVRSITMVKQRRRFATLRVEDRHGGSFDWSLGRAAAANLLAIAGHAASSR